MSAELRVPRIRPFAIADAAQVTELLHRAYAALAMRGMRYLASHQDIATTIDRATAEDAYSRVAEIDGRIVGTISLKPPWVPGPGYYARPDVAVLGQFAVAFELQRARIGTALAEVAEAKARELGASFLALDTSEHAVELIATYARHGFETVGEEQWDVTNYRSVIMSKQLG